jgi:hypothetical protein
MWLELAERTRLLADGMSDPVERRATLAIVADYETQAREAQYSAGSVSFSGAGSSRMW